MQTFIFSSFQESISLAFNQIITGIVTFLPTLLGAILVLLVGLVVASWVKSILIKLIKVTNLHTLITNPAILEFLKNAQFGQKIEEVIGEVVRWLIVTLFFMASMNILGFTTVIAFLNAIFGYLPSLFAAALILFVGAILAGILEKVTKGVLGGYDLSLSRFMGKFVSYTVMIVSILAAIRQLGIAQSFIDVIFTGFVATIALALGLGLGLGSKDLIKTLIEDWYSNLKKK